MLHLVAFPPEREDLTRQLLQQSASGDTLVLLEQGCRLAEAPSPLAPITDACTLLVIESDLRHHHAGEPDPAIQQIDYTGLARATEAHTASLAWFP